MKILSLTFYNINSLKVNDKGKPICIRFDASPLKDAGLFAITGPTGSGKSSLLDAITIALYARVPRHPKRNPEELMTKYTNECMSEVEFEAKGKIYRAKWLLRRAQKSGNTQPTVMELYELPPDSEPQMLESGVNNVPDKVREVCGLSYEQFTRSVLLAQGEFAAFLKAKENDRAELLEQITGTDYYSQISKAAFEREKKAREAYQALEKQCESYSLLTPEQRADKQSQIATITQNIVHQTAQLHNAQQYVQATSEYASLQTEHQQYTQQQAQIQEQLNHKKSDFDRLQQYEVALPAQSDLETWKYIAEKQAVINQRIEELEKTAIPHAAHNKQQANHAQRELRTLLLKQREHYTLIKPHLNTAQQTAAEIELLKQQIQQISGDITIRNNATQQTESQLNIYRQQQSEKLAKAQKLSDWLYQHQAIAEAKSALPILHNLLQQRKSTTTQNTEKQQQLDSLQSQIAQYAADIDRLKITVDAAQKAHNTAIQQQEHAQKKRALLPNIDECTTQIDQLKTAELIGQQQYILARDYFQKQAQIIELRAQYSQFSKSIKDISTQLQQIIQQYEAEKQLLQTYEKQREALRLIADLATHRLHLQEGQPCPLCGAQQHPYAHLLPEQNELSQIEQQLNNQKATLERFQIQKDSLQTQQKNLQIDLDNVEKTGKQLNAEINELQNTYQQLAAKITLTLNKLPITATNTEFEHQLANLNANLAQQQQQLAFINQSEKELATAQIQLHQSEKQCLQAEQALISKRETATQAEQKQRELQSDIAQLAHQQQQYNLQYTQHLSPFADQIPQQLNEDATLEWLQKNSVNYGKALETQQQNTTEIQQIEQKIAELNATCSVNDSEIARQNDLLQQQNNRLQQLQQEYDNLRAQYFANPLHDAQQERDHLENIIREAQESMDKAATFAQKAEQQWENYIQEKDLKLSEQVQLSEQYILLEGKLTAKLRQLGFNALEELETALDMTEPDRKTLAELKQTLQHNLSLLQQKTDDIQKKLTQLTAKFTNLLPLNLENAELQRQNAELQLAESNQTIGALQNELSIDAQQQIHFETLQLQFQKAQKQHKRWDMLNQVIGSAAGDKFRRYAQHLNLARLLEWANLNLQKLNPRYQLILKPKSDMDMLILDTYQADAQRSIESLSGGETFLTSLSLALALSNLAGQNTHIASLFIDEGFGTLDAESLDTVIATLENLQAEGKTIGIISHIDALKDRITTQIKLQKTNGGYSYVEIQANDYEPARRL